jgi:hypothetical protein
MHLNRLELEVLPKTFDNQFLIFLFWDQGQVYLLVVVFLVLQD